MAPRSTRQPRETPSRPGPPGRAGSDDQLARLAPLLPALMRAMQRNRGEVPDALRRESVGSRHASMLVSLATAGPATVSALAARLGMSTAHASLVVRDLARAGLIERDHDPADRRRIIVSVSDTAKPAMRIIRERMDGPLRQFLGELDAAEAELFIDQLRRFAELLGGE